MSLLLIIGIASYLVGLIGSWMFDGFVGIVAGIAAGAGAAIIVINQNQVDEPIGTMREEDPEVYKKEMMKAIRDRYGDEYLLRQLAEECCELGQAALKLIRSHRAETPMSQQTARDKLIEEMADVKVMWDAVNDVLMTNNDRSVMNMWEDEKLDRMEIRMLGGDRNDAEGRTESEM